MSDLIPAQTRKQAATTLGRMFVDLAPPEGGKFTDAMMESYVEKACRLPEQILNETVRWFCDGRHGSAFAPRPAEFMAKATQIWEEEAARRKRRRPEPSSEYEIRDGIRYSNGSPLLCDLPKTERDAAVKRVLLKYPVGAKIMEKFLGKTS